MPEPTSMELWFQEELSKAAAYHPDEQVVIVSIIGRSEQGRVSKAADFNHKIDTDLFQRPIPDISEQKRPSAIQSYFDPELNVIFFNLVSVHDTKHMLEILQNTCDGEDAESGSSIFELLEKRESYMTRQALFLFQVSHMVLLWHPTTSNDMWYLRYFRTMENLRLDVKGTIVEALATLEPGLVPREWAKNGRPCSPRLLCVYHSSPVLDDPERRVERDAVRRLEQSLEDQLYNIFRSSRIITNNSMNSLFALPFNQPFAYIARPKDDEGMLDGALGDVLESMGTTLSGGLARGVSGNSSDLFSEFIMEHICQAFAGGFNDNVKSMGSASFELPKLGQFAALAPVVYSTVMSEGKKEDVLSHLATEMHFSMSRCDKVYPYALTTYQDGLPPYYTAAEHANRLSHVQGILTSQARGPLLAKYLTRLVKECEEYWRDGRQSCEAVSLRGNNCVNQRHYLPIGEPEDKDMPVLPHNSKVSFYCTCSCGHRQSIREDPFDLKSANLDFFWSTPDFTCCHSVETRHDFPIFKPTNPEKCRAALSEDLEEEEIPKIQREHGHSGPEGRSSSTNKGSYSGSAYLADYPRHPPVGSNRDSAEEATGDRKSHDSQLSPPDVLSDTQEENETQNVDENQGLEAPEEEVAAASVASQNEPTELERLTGEAEDEISQSAAMDSEASKSAENKDDEPGERKSEEPVTNAVEYLPGMTQVQSSPGLLPLFSSWSLLCVGPSSLYTHAHGLREQPNFSHGSAFLLYWDATLTVSDLAKWQTQVEQLNVPVNPQLPKKTRPAAGRKGGTCTVSVKVFIGFEYECPRGHRFMLQATNKMLKHSGPGGPKEPAGELVRSDLPLHFPCSCRISPAYHGQLMRIHVVTPKMPVFVTVSPRVQPDPAFSNIFCPSGPPAKLPPAGYWILRFPYAYMADQRTFFHPPKPGQPAIGKLLKDALSVEPFE